MSGDGGIHFHGSVGAANVNTSSGVQVNGGSGTNVNSGAGTLNVGGQTFGSHSFEKVFNDMAEAARTEQPTFEPVPAAPEDDTVDHLDVADTYESPAALLEAARDEAAADIAAVEPMPIGQFEQKQKTWQERFSVLAPKILKVALAGGSAVLDSYVSQSPVVAGLRAALAALKE